jgi:hypothetical protein
MFDVSDGKWLNWFGQIVERIPGVRYHSSGEATCDRFLSRKDGLVHMQDPVLEKGGLAYGWCKVRYNIYRRAGMRGFKGVPTDAEVTCMLCITMEAECR